VPGNQAQTHELHGSLHLPQLTPNSRLQEDKSQIMTPHLINPKFRDMTSATPWQ